MFYYFFLMLLLFALLYFVSIKSLYYIRLLRESLSLKYINFVYFSRKHKIITFRSENVEMVEWAGDGGCKWKMLLFNEIKASKQNSQREMKTYCILSFKVPKCLLHKLTVTCSKYSKQITYFLDCQSFEFV